jgi:DNA-nicking Smr family endonuclease
MVRFFSVLFQHGPYRSCPAHNQSRISHTIDVHRLRVPEAIRVTNEAVRDRVMKGGGRLRVIVGRGRHSHGGISVLKPAIMIEMQKFV